MQANNIVVAYFSATGNTARVARRLSRAVNSDLFEIKPEKAYSMQDLDWTNPESRCSLEHKNKITLPSLNEHLRNLAQYKAMFLGFPVWWYKQPPIISQFLKSHNLKHMVIIPFCTSGGTQMEEVQIALENEFPELDIRPGRLMNVTLPDEALEYWFSTLNIEPVKFSIVD